MHDAIEREKAFQKNFAALHCKRIRSLGKNDLNEEISISSSTATWMFVVQPLNRTEVKTCAQ
jgi:hypothetical protein